MPELKEKLPGIQHVGTDLDTLLNFKMFSRNKLKQIHISSDPQTMDAWLRYSLVGLYMIIYRVAAFSDDFQQVLLLSLIHFLRRIKSYLHLKEVIGLPINLCVFHAIFASSAGQVPLPENVLHNKQWHQRQQENYQPADLPGHRKSMPTELWNHM